MPVRKYRNSLAEPLAARSLDGLGGRSVAIDRRPEFPAKHVEAAGVIDVLMGNEDGVDGRGLDAGGLQPRANLARAQTAIDEQTAGGSLDQGAISGAARAEDGHSEHDEINAPGDGTRQSESKESNCRCFRKVLPPSITPIYPRESLHSTILGADSWVHDESSLDRVGGGACIACGLGARGDVVGGIDACSSARGAGGEIEYRKREADQAARRRQRRRRALESESAQLRAARAMAGARLEPEASPMPEDETKAKGRADFWRRCSRTPQCARCWRPSRRSRCGDSIRIS